MSWPLQDEQDKITNAEREYMAQWWEAMQARGQIVRDNTLRIKAHNQGELYKLCPCGSLRKYKFCCYKKPHG